MFEPQCIIVFMHVIESMVILVRLNKGDNLIMTLLINFEIIIICMFNYYSYLYKYLDF